MFFHKCSKSKYHRFRQNNFFGTHFSCEKHPLYVFCFFPPLHANFFSKKNYLPILGELRKLHAKIYTFSVKIDREINFQSWLLYDCFFHSCYNFAIVHCEDVFWAQNTFILISSDWFRQFKITMDELSKLVFLWFVIWNFSWISFLLQSTLIDIWLFCLTSDKSTQ